MYGDLWSEWEGKTQGVPKAVKSMRGDLNDFVKYHKLINANVTREYAAAEAAEKKGPA